MINEHPLWKTTGNGGWREGRDNIAAYGTTKGCHDMTINGRRTGGETAGSERDKK